MRKGDVDDTPKGCVAYVLTAKLGRNDRLEVVPKHFECSICKWIVHPLYLCLNWSLGKKSFEWEQAVSVQSLVPVNLNPEN